MKTTRDRIVTAAVTLVGERGTRAFTHRQVDAKAGLPIGSTSNYFRTKAALLKGAVEGVLNHEMPLVQLTASVESPDQLVDLLTQIVTQATRPPMETVTAARLTLFLEGRLDSELRGWIEEARRTRVDVLSGLLKRLEAPTPDASAQALLAMLEGFIVDGITCTTDVDLHSSFDVVVTGLFAQR